MKRWLKKKIKKQATSTPIKASHGSSPVILCDITVIVSSINAPSISDRKPNKKIKKICFR